MHKKIGGIDNKNELDKYFGEESEEEENGFDILKWWKLNSPRFSILAQIAHDVLAVPISTVASELAFSMGGRVLDTFRSSLTPRMVQCLMCAKDWLRNEASPISIEEDLEVLEKMDNGNLSFIFYNFFSFSFWLIFTHILISFVI